MKKLLIILWLPFAIITSASAQNLSALHKKHYNLDKAGLALAGYDPVSYFNVHKAVEGSKSISFTNEGVTYYFANTADRDIFKVNPAQYMPQYGGWCAYAMGATGEKVSVDPETFKITDGKLYLFYNKFFNNTKKSWNKDESNLKTNADASWLKITK